MTSNALHFVQQSDIVPKPLYVDENTLPLTLSLALESLEEVLPRWYQLNDCALELFFDTGGVTTRFLAFSSPKHRDSFMHRLSSLNPRCFNNEAASSTVRQSSLQRTQRQWQEGKMSNFDYLMYLNKLSGRTVNDLMQYPIFPFILSDYTSDIIDLTSAKSFRDLHKPGKSSTSLFLYFWWVFL